MHPTKARCARICFAVGLIGLILGGLLGCPCPGWFVGTALFLTIPGAWGTRWLRVAAIVLCLLAIWAAALDFQKLREAAAARAQRQLLRPK